jgi:hypothetical protein
MDSNNKLLYNDAVAHLKANAAIFTDEGATAPVHYDWWKGQYEQPDQAQPYNRPACFFEFGEVEWQSGGGFKRTGLQQITVHVVQDIYSDSADGNAGKATFETKTDYADLVDTLLDGFRATCSGKWTSLGDEPDNDNDNLHIRKLIYRARVWKEEGKLFKKTDSLSRFSDEELVEGLTQPKINGLAEPATWQNSDLSIVQEIPAGDIYDAPDVNHIDSNGAPVPTPAGVAFVATLISDPRFAGAELADDNTYIDLYFTEAMYSTALASGALEIADLNLTFQKNGGDATAASISSITKLDGTSALEGGEIGIRLLALNITGTPSGVETITISPVLDAVFDAGGNAMSTSESETITLRQGYSADAILVFDRIEAGSGETLTAAEKSDIDALVRSVTWANYQFFLPFFGLETVAKSKVCWVTGKVITLVNAPTWTKAGGFTLNSGSAQYLNAIFNPALDGLHINNHTIGIGLGNYPAAGDHALCGVVDGSGAKAIELRDAGTNRFYAGGDSNTEAVISPGNWAPNTRYYGKKVASNDQRIYEGSTLLNSNAPTKEGLPNKNLYVGAVNWTAPAYLTGAITDALIGVGGLDIATHENAMSNWKTNRGI